MVMPTDSPGIESIGSMREYHGVEQSPKGSFISWSEMLDVYFTRSGGALSETTVTNEGFNEGFTVLPKTQCDFWSDLAR